MKRLPFIHTPPRHHIDRVIEYDQMKMGVEGVVTVQLIDAKSGIIKRELVMKNLITDVGLDSLGGAHSLSYWYSSSPYAGVGTGSTTPDVTDTTLVTEVSPASTNRTQSDGGFGNTTAYVAGPPDYWWWKRTWVFTETQGNGNLTEIGIFDAVTSGSMWMRQLLKDSGGTPTTIVKTSADQLRVIYEIRLYPPVSDVLDTVTISGTPYDMVWRAMGASSASNWGRLGTWFGGTTASARETDTLSTRTGSGPAGTEVARSSQSFAAYSNGNFYRDMTAVWEPGVANFATGIGSCTMMDAFSSASHCFQVSFAPKFAKDNTKRLTLISRISWDRV